MRYPISELNRHMRGRETETFTMRLPMNKTVVIVIVVAAVVIGLPLAGKLMQSSNSSAPASEGDASGSAAPAEVKPPALDANSLANTVWSMKMDKATLTVTFQPGGTLVAQGTPEDLIAHPTSYTGIFLKQHLDAQG